MSLVEHLICQLQLSRQQAEGGVGLLFLLAKNHLIDEQFLVVADAVPAVSDLIGKAPRNSLSESALLRTWWLKLFGGWGRLASLRPACKKLGLDRATLEKMIETCSCYIGERCGAQVQSLLLSVWR